jgi:glycosyltransferase involved in cell wall biosynthesis
MLRRKLDARLHVAHRVIESEGISQIRYVRGVPGSRRLARTIEASTGGQYLYSPSFRTLLGELRGSADVVHFHSLHGAQAYAELWPIKSFSRQVPSVLTMHDLWLFTGHCAQPMGCGKWLQGCGNCPDLTIAPAIPRDGTRLNWRYKRQVFKTAPVHLSVPSRWVQKLVAQSPILGHLPSVVIPNPVDTNIFSPGSQRHARLELGLPLDRPIALLVAQSLLLVFKGGELGIDAVANARVPNLFLVAIGPDAQLALSKSRVDGIAVGYQTDRSRLAMYYRAADVLVMPSRAETFGMVAAEAMACGTPVVAFAAGGLVDVIGTNDGGLLVPELDVASMSVAIRALLFDDERRAALGQQAAQRAVREFSLTHHTDKTLKLYERAVQDF